MNLPKSVLSTEYLCKIIELKLFALGEWAVVVFAQAPINCHMRQVSYEQYIVDVNSICAQTQYVLFLWENYSPVQGKKILCIGSKTQILCMARLLYLQLGIVILFAALFAFLHFYYWPNK